MYVNETLGKKGKSNELSGGKHDFTHRSCINHTRYFSFIAKSSTKWWDYSDMKKWHLMRSFSI